MRHLSISSKLFSNNRKKLCGKLPDKAIAVANANDVLPTNADGTLPLHPNSDLFYLSGIEQEESLLVLFPDCSNPEASGNFVRSSTKRTFKNLGRL
jgi:Xaa-Pro aminopeptidase